MKRALSAAELLEGIRNDVLDARLNFDVYRIYKHTDTRRKYWSVRLSYEAFFATSLRAHFVAMVAALGRLFDADPKSVSLETLLKICPQFEKVEAAKLALARASWKKHAMTLRHQMVAHRAATTTAAEAFKRAQITLADIDELITLCEELVTAWSKAAGCHVNILSSSKGDTLALLDRMLEVDR
jgi:hypothetical protein